VTSPSHASSLQFFLPCFFGTTPPTPTFSTVSPRAACFRFRRLRSAVLRAVSLLGRPLFVRFSSHAEHCLARPNPLRSSEVTFFIPTVFFFKRDRFFSYDWGNFFFLLRRTVLLSILFFPSRDSFRNLRFFLVLRRLVGQFLTSRFGMVVCLRFAAGPLALTREKCSRIYLFFRELGLFR